jgi:hypothetical protein
MVVLRSCEKNRGCSGGGGLPIGESTLPLLPEPEPGPLTPPPNHSGRGSKLRPAQLSKQQSLIDWGMGKRWSEGNRSAPPAANSTTLPPPLGGGVNVYV